MKIICLAAAALVTLACAACHSEETRNKVDNLVAEQEARENAAANDVPATANKVQPPQ